jgi:hypothetical protein
MVKHILCCVLAAVVCTGCVSIHAEKSSVAVKPECKKAVSVTAPMLRHVVLFKFKEGTTPEKIKEVENAFAALPGKIDAIKYFEWGTNVSVENRSEGFTHCFVISFLNETGRDIYLNHPDHKAFGKTLGGSLDKVLVVDYWAK